MAAFQAATDCTGRGIVAMQLKQNQNRAQSRTRISTMIATSTSAQSPSQHCSSSRFRGASAKLPARRPRSSSIAAHLCPPVSESSQSPSVIPAPQSSSDSAVSSSGPSSVSPVSLLPPSSSIEDYIQALQAALLKSPQQESQEQEGLQESQQQTQQRSSWDDIPLWKSEHSFTNRAKQPSWNPIQSLAAAALDAIEKKLIPKLEGSKLPSTANPAIQLEGNFAPVSETPVSDTLPVRAARGTGLPEELSGLYVRNGANPRFKPIAGHHLFDGDGMLHAVRIKDGEASYCSRFTKTHRLCEEERLGRAFFPKAVGELHGHGGAARLLLFYARSLFGLVDASKGMGPANAGLVFFDGKLLAMSEDDQPYAVRIDERGEIETIGRYDFHGQLQTSSMIAHPKKDPRTGELFALSYDVVKKPYLRYFSFAADGSKRPDVEIELEQPTMMHDFAITDKYVVIPDQQVVFQLKRMLSGQSPVVYDSVKKARFGVLPKYATDSSSMRWVEVPDCFCFHVWNAWEEDEEIVVLGSCMTPPDCVFNDHEQEGEAMQSVLCEIRLNLVTGESKRTPIAGLNLEAGTVNRHVLGRRSRFLYLAIADPWPKISGIAKVDLSLKDKEENQDADCDCVVGRRIHGDNCFGGEPFFVPRTSDPNAAEDDGYVLTFVHNESTGCSELHILDAATDNLELIAAVCLPSRVPYGFHGTFLSEQDLASQHD